MKCVTNKFQNSTNNPPSTTPIYEKDRTNLSEYHFKQREINSSIEFVPFVSAKLDIYNLHKSVASSIRCVYVNKSTDKHSSTKELYYKLTPDFLVRLIRSVEHRYPRINSSLPESEIAYELIGELSDKCLLMYGIGAITEALDRAEKLIKSGKRLPPLPEPERCPGMSDQIGINTEHRGDWPAVSGNANPSSGSTGELPEHRTKSPHAKAKQGTQAKSRKARHETPKGADPTGPATGDQPGGSLFG